jgi:hypothetical protein
MSFSAEAARLQALLREYEAARTASNLRAYSNQLEVLRRFFDLDAVPGAFRATAGNDAVVQMVDILNRLPDAQIRPEATQTVAEPMTNQVWAIPDTEIVLVRRQEGADAGNFVIPPDVIAQLPNFHEQVLALPLLRETGFDDMKSMQANLTGPHLPPGTAISIQITDFRSGRPDAIRRGVQRP